MERIATKRWDEPAAPGDGFRLLVCRFRPRGVEKAAETWNAWWPNLGPSRELHAAYYGKGGAPIEWAEYRRRYLDEMKQQRSAIDAIAERVASGQPVTLLCSSACVDAERCHRTLLKKLVLERLR
jgi:uncharacterized protein YeaO (DUF488 family)